jgi:hypothetical protein
MQRIDEFTNKLSEGQLKDLVAARIRHGKRLSKPTKQEQLFNDINVNVEVYDESNYQTELVDLWHKHCFNPLNSSVFQCVCSDCRNNKSKNGSLTPFMESG